MSNLKINNTGAILIILLLLSCTKAEKFECVCYSNQSPEQYQKYNIQNSYAESKKYCDTLSNTNQKCYLSN
jgi:hypothetical protein